jgi:UDP-glucose 4-epimerase
MLRQATKYRILVTCGAGFVGSHLAERLCAEGHRVVALDNLTTGSTDNLSSLSCEPGFELVLGDIGDTELVESLVADSDVVFHLAAAVGVKTILADPIQSFRTNVLGTETVLEAALRYRRKVLVASTSEVYGKVTRLPQHEDDDVLLGPTSISRWSYAASKMLDEFVTLAHCRRGLRGVVFRLFNTVGPRQTGRYGMVIPRFVEAALAEQPLLVYGDGSQSRCFLHVADAVDALVRLAATDRAVGTVVNVGAVESVTIAELARRVLVAVDVHRHSGAGTAPLASLQPELIRHVSFAEAYPEGGFEDIQARLPDITRIRQLTRWQPRRTLEDILRDVVAERTVAALAHAAEPEAVAIA